MRFNLKGIDRPDNVVSTVEFFTSKHPALEGRIGLVAAVGGLGELVARAHSNGNIGINAERFNKLSSAQQRHVVAHECYHIAHWYMVSNGLKIVFDLAPGEDRTISCNAACSDVECYCEIGAYGLLGYMKVLAIGRNWEMIEACLS